MVMSVLYTISKVLVIIGGLNWGLVGLFNFDLIAAIFGQKSVVSRIIYVLVGLAAVIVCVTFIKLKCAAR
jgi:hypothetical protein